MNEVIDEPKPVITSYSIHYTKLYEAMAGGLVNSVDDLYTAARTILVKSEKYFDIYDQVFAHIFQGLELPDVDDLAMELLARSMLHEWLKDPKTLANALGLDEKKSYNFV